MPSYITFTFHDTTCVKKPSFYHTLSDGTMFDGFIFHGGRLKSHHLIIDN